MPSPCMQGWTPTLTAYTYTPRYIPRRDNAVTDALSRLPFEDDSLKKSPVFEAVNLQQHLLSQREDLNDSRPHTITSKACITTGIAQVCPPPEIKPAFFAENE